MGQDLPPDSVKAEGARARAKDSFTLNAQIESFALAQSLLSSKELTYSREATECRKQGESNHCLEIIEILGILSGMRRPFAMTPCSVSYLIGL